MKRCTIALILLCFPVGPALARTVTLVDRSPDGRCLRDGAALLVTISGEEQRHSVDASTKLELTAAAAVRLEKKGCWSARVPEGEGDVVLDVYSSAEVGGQFTSKTPPAKLAGFVSLTAGSRSKPARFDGDHSIHCQLDYPNWNCVVPSGLPIDIRLEPGGFAPVHFFDVLAGTEAGRSMERQTLTRGASLAGWLETHDGASVEGARLTLVAAAGSTARAIAHTTSNKRGFFQFVGLPGGEFHLKSEASDRSPASLPVSVLAEQALMLPRPLVHVELVTLAVRLTPPVQEDGSKWRVALSEIPAAPNATVIQRPASDEGLWQASGLAAGMWRLNIKDRENSVVEETTIDLSRGSPADELSIDIASIKVTGSVKVGGKGLASAEVKLVNRAGKRVRTETDDEGNFRASFPTRGEWTPMVRAERDRGAEIRAETVLIPESDSPTIEVVLPLGRIVGEVVDEQGKPVRAAVHLFQKERLKAQQISDEEGRFDFIGVAEGGYVLDAQGEKGTTPRPVSVEVEDQDTAEVKLELASYTVLSATVVTASGYPASGAIVRVSTNAGVSWIDIVTDVRGTFEHYIAAGSASVELIVLAHPSPTSIMTVSLSGKPAESISIQLAPQGGLLGVIHKEGMNRAILFQGQTRVPFGMLFPPGMPFGPFNGRAHLAPGRYRLCPDASAASVECKSTTVGPGTESIVDLTSTKEAEAHGGV